ncbi:MAG: glycerol kinase GlpK [Deltaproteobacteria bacterium]|nr:glycerol kinase GlpK [Deltaproteobacteria bacterium]
MPYILALDQGTTSSRAIIFDQSGGIISTAQREFVQHYPKPGWVEHDPVEIWQSQAVCASEAVTKAGLTRTDIAAIGITNQRETTLLWDRHTGKPVYNAIVWQDRRTAAICDELQKRGFAELIRGKTGLVIDAYFSGSKIKWMLEHGEGLRQKAEAGDLAFGTIDSWLIWNLTGGKRHITDVSNASRTMMFNIHTGQWDDELLSILDIPRSVLPEVRSSSEIYGETLGALLFGGIPIGGIAGDQQAALFGQLCTQPGLVKNTYGTGCFMVMNTGDKPIASQNNLLTTVAWKIGNKMVYALEGSIFIAGAVVQWLRDSLGIIKSSDEVEVLAGQVTDSAGVYFVPAFVGLGAPHWDPYARGTLVGLTRGSGAAHIARAALESIAFQSRDVLLAMTTDSGIAIDELRVDGGATANNLLMQFQADIIGVPVIRPPIAETTALGAAYLAGLAIGYWDNLDDIAGRLQEGKRFEPAMESSRVAELTNGWRRALERSRDWIEK